MESLNSSSLRFIISILLIQVCTVSFAQIEKTKTKFGFQYKPIIPNRFIGQNIQEFESESAPVFSGNFQQKFGYSAGIAIRHQFTSYFSVESAINFVKRNYDFTYNVIDSGFTATSDVSFIGYDIPINGLIYVQLADQWFMNASAGINFGFYPTSVQSFNEDSSTKNIFKQLTSPRRRIQLGLNINYGFEYRVKKLGDFYVGATYLLPFSSIAINQMTWSTNGGERIVREEVIGSFFTLDFKYFFPK
ncbi:MAG: outer membrane beta-barrel protein [Crocinitomicaceae bacterium]